MKKFIMYFIALSSTIFATLTSPGDLSFIGFNADGNDDFAVAVLKDVDATQVVEFCDDEWNGTSFGTGEADFRWHPPAGGVPAGTVVIFNNVDSTSPTVSIGTVEGDAMGISGSGETIYSYLGTNRNPTVFLGIVSTKSDDLDGTSGSLSGTDCSIDSNTVIYLYNGIDCAKYEGTRSEESAFVDYLPLIGETSNWKIVVGGSGDQSSEILPFNGTPFTLSGSAVPTNILKVVSLVNQDVITSAPNVAVDVIVESALLSGTLSVGLGKEASGSDWSWTNILISGSSSPYVSTNSIYPSLPGNYYYGVRWTDDSYTYFGWNSEGQTNEPVMQAEYLIVVTNPVPPPKLIITEVMSSSSHPGGFANADWFEIYNSEDIAVDISGWSCDDESATPGVAVFPSNTVIAAKGILVVTDETLGEEASFIDAWDMPSHGKTNVINLGGDLPGLGSSGDAVFLFDAAGVEVDSVTFGAATNGHSFAWNVYGDYLGISYESIYGAWQASKNGTNDAPIGSGTDIASPGVVIPEPNFLMLIIIATILLLAKKNVVLS